MRAALRFMLPLFIFAGVYTGGGAGISFANAESCLSMADQCTEGQAYLICRTQLTSYISSRAPVKHQNDRCEKEYPGSPNSVASRFEYQNSFGNWTPGAYRTYYFTKGCSAEPSYTGVGPWSSGGAARNGSIGCRNGCDGVWYRNSDFTMTWSVTGDRCPDNEKSNCEQMGEGFYWNSLLKVCEPPEGKCPGNSKANSLGKCEPEPCPDGKVLQHDGTCKTKESECPAGNIKSPDGKCLPGEGQCAQGETRGNDGTCKKDSDGDGEPDEETGEPGEKEPDSFSGGDGCKTPPSCSGSAILCGQARIQWRIDCNTRRNRNIAGGQCNTPPVCTGDKCDALEYSGLLMQWRTACALEKAAGGSGDSGDLAAIRNALTGTGGSVNPGTLPGSDAWVTGTGQPTKPNTAGYGWSGSCPAIPAVSFMGTSIQIDATPICNWLSLGSFFVMGLAALGSLRIVASKDS